MVVAATAPGKAVLLGEYAVLEGAPALAMAVNRLVRAELRPKSLGECSVSAPALYPHSAYFKIPADGGFHWLGDTGSWENYTLLESVIDVLNSQRRLDFSAHPRFDIHLDTSALFLADKNGVSLKLGLGSSAALTAALARALAEYSGWSGLSRDGWLSILLHAHRRFQCGRGSGIDIAASLCGGVIEYQLTDDLPHVEPLSLPLDLEMAFVWTGRTASTRGFLERLHTWRGQNEVDYAAIMRDLRVASLSGIQAARRGDSAVFIEAVSQFISILTVLGDYTGLDIYCSEHRELAAMAKTAGLVYKPCGAGGGDLGVALSTDTDRIRKFLNLVSISGYQAIDIAPDSEGAKTVRSQ